MPPSLRPDHEPSRSHANRLRSSAPAGGFVAIVGLVVLIIASAGPGGSVPSRPLASITDDGAILRYDSAESEALGREALGQIDHDWERWLPDWRIDFVAGDTEVAGYAWSRERRIEVFVRPDSDSTTLARVLAHELGHAVDVSHNTADERTMWLEQRGIAPETPWWPRSGAADFATGAGDFAEVFAVWLMGADDFRSEVGPLPDDADLALIAQLTVSP